MLYMQELEKMEGYGQESYQAKVGLRDFGLLESELVKLHILATTAQHDQIGIG